MTGAQILLHTLQKNNVSLLLGYTGGAIMPIFDTFKEFPDLTFISTRHEQGATFIAQGYTRACGKLAPIFVTSGPGATNLVTGVADAQMDSVPMLTITGQVARPVVGTDAFQETDVTGLMYPITKHSQMPLHADEIAQTVQDAIHIATTGRPGPVNIDIPKDVQTEISELITADTPNLPGYTPYLNVDEADIEAAVQAIQSAQKPVILAGHGVILSQVGDELKALVETAQIPVSTTLHGISCLPSSHPMNLGMMGMHGEIEANRAIQNADLLVALGMRFDDRVTGKLSAYAKNATVIHVEVDPSEIHKNVPADIALNGRLQDVLPQIIAKIDPQAIPDRQHWLASIELNRQKSQQYYAEVYNTGTGPHGRLLMSRVIHDLSEITNGQGNIVSDVGQHQMFSAKFYKYERFNTWFASGGLGTMGFGLPAAIGVKLARPEEEVWSINGDGGFQMNIQELGTILQENLNINIILLNNSFLGMVKQWQTLFFDDNFAETEMINPDFSHLAAAYNLAYRKVEKVEDIRPALQWSKHEQKATIVEFICDHKEMVWPMLPTGASFEDLLENADHARTTLGLK